MGNSSARLLLIGLDNAGKSTILARIIDPDFSANGITPTIGFKKDTFSRSGVDFEVLDMSGESKYRDLWQTNAVGNSDRDRIEGIIFVVDSSDRMRLRVARSELDMILDSKAISNEIPFLFYANKNDVKGACPLE
jgi:ADP-ribosylation factor-like protein 6